MRRILRFCLRKSARALPSRAALEVVSDARRTVNALNARVARRLAHDCRAGAWRRKASAIECALQQEGAGRPRVLLVRRFAVLSPRHCGARRTAGLLKTLREDFDIVLRSHEAALYDGAQLRRISTAVTRSSLCNAGKNPKRATACRFDEAMRTLRIPPSVPRRAACAALSTRLGKSSTRNCLP